MNIYQISTDFQYKDITGRDEISKQFHYFTGQSLKNQWSIVVFDKLIDVITSINDKKSENKKQDDFDARCYGNMFVLKDKYSLLINDLPIEILPIKINGIDEAFNFINVLNVIESIDFGNMDYKEFMGLARNNKIPFILEKIEDEYIFRDKKLCTFYYCTDKFIEIIQNNNIKGLKFGIVGNTK
jgi:hypothetical protein